MCHAHPRHSHRYAGALRFLPSLGYHLEISDHLAPEVERGPIWRRNFATLGSAVWPSFMPTLEPAHYDAGQRDTPARVVRLGAMSSRRDPNLSAINPLNIARLVAREVRQEWDITAPSARAARAAWKEVSGRWNKHLLTLEYGRLALFFVVSGALEVSTLHALAGMRPWHEVMPDGRFDPIVDWMQRSVLESITWTTGFTAVVTILYALRTFLLFVRARSGLSERLCKRAWWSC